MTPKLQLAFKATILVWLALLIIELTLIIKEAIK